MENTTEAAFAYFDKLANMKKSIENNKLSTRKDVQVLRRKIALLNQELIFLKRNMEQAKLAYEHATDVYKTKCKMHKQFLSHLTIISDKHNEQQKIKVDKLMKLMREGQYHEACKKTELQADDTLDLSEEQHGN